MTARFDEHPLAPIAAAWVAGTLGLLVLGRWLGRAS